MKRHVILTAFVVVAISHVAVPAWMMLGYWIVLQFFGGLLAGVKSGSGVAYMAHIGGFVAGLALIRLFARPDYLARRPVHATEWGSRFSQ